MILWCPFLPTHSVIPAVLWTEITARTQTKELMSCWWAWVNGAFKGIVHSKMKTLSLITHPHVIPKPSFQDLCSSSEHKLKYLRVRKLSDFINKYLNLRSENEQWPYRLGTTWGGVTHDIIFIFGWTIPLNKGAKNISQKVFYVRQYHPVKITHFIHCMLCTRSSSVVHRV